METTHFKNILEAYISITTNKKTITDLDGLCREIVDNISGYYDTEVTKEIISKDENLTVRQKTIAYKILNFNLLF